MLGWVLMAMLQCRFWAVSGEGPNGFPWRLAQVEVRHASDAKSAMTANTFLLGQLRRRSPVLVLLRDGAKAGRELMREDAAWSPHFAHGIGRCARGRHAAIDLAHARVLLILRAWWA